MSTISIEVAVRQTMASLYIRDDEDRIERALTEITIIAEAFGKTRNFRAGWEDHFAGMYVRPLGFVGQAALLERLDLDWRSTPRRDMEWDEMTIGEATYVTAYEWITLLVRSIFVRLGK